MKGSLIRCKLVCAEHGPVLIALLAVLGVAAFAGAGWAYTHPPTATTTVDTHQQTFATTTNTSAVVTGNTSLWERGTRLEGRSLYPMSAPNLTIHAETRVPTRTKVRVVHRLDAVYRVRTDGETVWRTEESLENEAAAVFDGGATMERTIDVRRLAERRDRFNEELIGIGRVDVFLRLSVEYESNRYSGTLAKQVPVSIGAKAYKIEGSFDAREMRATPATRHVTRDNSSTYLGLAGLGLGALLGAAVAGYVSRRGDDPDELATQLDRLRFEDWISEGRISRPIGGHDVSIRSLEDLVDVAIDSNRRVIYDPTRDIYAVVDAGVLYYYAPNGVEEVPSLPEPKGDDAGTERTSGSPESHDPWNRLFEESADPEDEGHGVRGDDDPAADDGPEPGQAMTDGSHDPWTDFLDDG